VKRRQKRDIVTDMSNEDIRWILDTLKTAMRLLDVTNREVESRMGWSHGYLSRIFAGNIELRVEHVIDIVRILGLSPSEFFDLAYPRLPDPPSPVAERLRSLLRRYQPDLPPKPREEAVLPGGHIAAIVRQVVDELRREEGAPPP
jgi:transcriptional regulator with XRE-family HTH domain